MYGLNSGAVWIVYADLLCTEEIALKFGSAVNEYLLVISFFKLIFSLKFDVVEGALNELVVLSGICLSCLSSLCAQPILMAVVDDL